MDRTIAQEDVKDGGGNECRIVLVLATEMLRKVSGRIYELKSHTENFT